MSDYPTAQTELHPALVNAEAHELIALAREYGAIEWKVNRAGRDAGSLTLLCGESAGAPIAATYNRTVESAVPPIRIYLC
jgi:hypothetical protein